LKGLDEWAVEGAGKGLSELTVMQAGMGKGGCADYGAWRGVFLGKLVDVWDSVREDSEWLVGVVDEYFVVSSEWVGGGVWEINWTLSSLSTRDRSRNTKMTARKDVYFSFLSL